MHPNDLPQPNITGDPEIYRVLKIGSFSVTANESAFVVTHDAEPRIEDAPTVIKISAQKLWDKTKIVRSIMIYPLIFGISFLFFYTAMNFPSLAAQASGFFSSGKTQDSSLSGTDLTAYNSWISGYFYAVTNHDLLAANNDYDHDGLTNYDEYIMQTNPTLADSDNDGTTDGVELLNGTNPWGNGPLTKAQSKLREQIDLNMVSERITYAVSSNKSKTTTENSVVSNFDLSKPGMLSIPKLKINAPLIFSPDPSAFDKDLEHGVIHYPGTALPGQTGTMYVSGHSSDYIWKHDKFATIFTKINYLQPGDDIFVTVYGKNGQVYNFRYRVTEQHIFSPDDQTQFIDNSVAKLNLSTCWPIGTSKDRMVVSATLSPL